MTKRQRISKIILVLIGISMIAFALWAGGANLIGLEAGQGGQITLIIFGVLLIALNFMGRGAGKSYPKIAVMLLNTALMLVVIELLVLLSFNLQLLASGQVRAPTHTDLSYYDDQPWGATYWEEHRIAMDSVRYRPYVLWGQLPHQGETINQLPDGTRLTPGAECDSPEAYRVFMFGGSTLWGMGAPDSGTIPAYVQAALDAQRDQPVCVINYGEFSFVNTQEVIRLMLELREGNIPDLVIFYDGINDVVSAHQNGVAGLHRQMGVFAPLFTEQTSSGSLSDWLRNTYTARFLSGLIGRGGGSTGMLMPTSDTPLAQGVVDAYLGNYGIVDALAAAYGFDYIFIWQPVLFIGEKPMTPEEALLVQAVPDGLDDLYTESYALVEAAAPEHPNLFYLAGVFDNTTEMVYLDHQHLIPEGNAIVAREIVALLER